MKLQGISDEEFLRGRAQIKASLLFAQENCASQMLVYGKHMLYTNSVFDYEKKIAALDALTKDDVMEAIGRTFNESKKSVAAVGVIEKPFVL